ncbi:MAG: hypothetical protein EOR25_29710 [Mesorhizobium sp.]|uniref:hypothetical protein n=1 Tax=Mesorhizobium sp. TaxID=1871066 RepID=UPI000FE3260E|nr:hypothetical protein [Mesorhizobium sp.]RWJ04845.1 MAG: hypothetical protein EOR24_29645 [Mesorhizobium sp.]RWJ12003.1 MAG: hypothetical protein EOR25_29710 [Mesorhizobium sp.]
MSIVTLPCDTARAVSFDVIGVHGDRVFVVDLNDSWNGYTPVVAAAREVFQYCNATYGAGCIICNDARDDWQEIVPEQGAFAIAPYQGKIPLMVEVKSLMAGRLRNMLGGSI